MKYGLLSSIVILTLILSGVMYQRKIQSVLGSSFEPLFTVLGSAPKSVDRLVSRVVLRPDLDEKTLGDAFKMRLSHSALDSPYTEYLNHLIKSLTEDSKKPFEYQVFVVSGMPNAFALPGGALGITTGLLEILEDEAALVGILGHEIAHVELNHCYDAFKFSSLAKKLTGSRLGEVVDRFYNFFTRSSFSKTQEAESDEYGFNLLLKYGYDPMGSARAFDLLVDASEASRAKGGSPIRAFFRSHPTGKLRAKNFLDKGKRELSEGDQYYVGMVNYEDKITKFQTAYATELMTFPPSLGEDWE